MEKCQRLPCPDIHADQQIPKGTGKMKPTVKHKSGSASVSPAAARSGRSGTRTITDRRPLAVQQRKSAIAANRSPSTLQQQTIQAVANQVRAPARAFAAPQTIGGSTPDPDRGRDPVLAAVRSVTSVQRPPVSSGRSAPVQRVKKQVIVTGLSHLVKMSGKTIYGGRQEREIVHGQLLVIDTDGKKNSRRGPNQEDYAATDKHGPQHYSWFKVISVDGKSAPKGLYVREDVFEHVKPGSGGSDKLDKAHDAVEAVTNVPATLIGNEGITGAADALNDKTVSTNTGGGTGATDSEKQHAANMGIVGDSITGVTGLLGMARGFKDLGDPEAKAADLVETALAIEQGGMKTGEAVSKLVHTASGSQDPTTASKFGSAFEGYGAAFGALREAFSAMRKIVKAINNRKENTTQDKVKAAGEISLHLLETAKSVVLSVKSFIELVNGAASGGLMASVPGLDIAVSAGKLIMDGYYLAVSNSSRKVMNQRRKEIIKAKGGDAEALDKASNEYRSIDAEIANKKAVIDSDQERVSNPKTSAKDKKRLKKRISRLKGEIKQLEKQKSDEFSRDDVAEYTLATELRDANTKRVTRQGIHIATEMTKIAGSIATLTGVGALGGAITKGAASAVDLALPATRLAKQAGRNRAARKMAKGKMNKSRFNPTRSTAAKTDFRIRQIRHLLKMIVHFSYRKPNKRNKEARNILAYLKASGVNTERLFRKNGDPQAQIKMLLDAMQEREFI